MGSLVWLIIGTIAGAVVLSQTSAGIYSAVGALTIFAFLNFLLFEGSLWGRGEWRSQATRLASKIKELSHAYFASDGVEIRRPRMH